MYVCVPMPNLRMCKGKYPQKLEEGIGSSRTEVKGIFWLPNMGARNWSSTRAGHAVHWISPDFHQPFIYLFWRNVYLGTLPFLSFYLYCWVVIFLTLLILDTRPLQDKIYVFSPALWIFSLARSCPWKHITLIKFNLIFFGCSWFEYHTLKTMA